MTSQTEPVRNTIFALSSGMGKSGVAVIRVSGPDAGKTLTRLAGELPKPRLASLRPLKNPETNEPIDRGLVLWFPGPHSFTGEDIAELQFHGGRAVIASLINVLANETGLRAAEPGEFTRRAFENGKLDLTETEGLADLIDADTEAQRAQALRQMAGQLSLVYEGWRSDLIMAQALIEAEIDFSDEQDVSDSSIHAATEILTRIKAEISSHLDDGKCGEIIRDGFRVVLAGPPNVGKSSLLNALAKRDAAIISPHAGTTRDAIEVFLDLDGWPVHITDTAGIREDGDISDVEQQGISRSLKHIESAGLVIWVMDATAPESIDCQKLPVNAQNRSLITIANKSDLQGDRRLDHTGLEPDLLISARTGHGLNRLISLITRSAAEQMTAPEAPIITRHRHREHLNQCMQEIDVYLTHPEKELELRAEDLRRAATAIGRITGRIGVEDILDDIFASFCIGK